MKSISKHQIKIYAWLVLLTVLTGVTLTAARFQADELIQGVEAEVVLLEKGNNLIQPEEFVALVAKKSCSLWAPRCGTRATGCSSPLTSA